MPDVRFLLTGGLPGAGKTTLARRLASERGAVRLTKDDWLVALGTVNAPPTPPRHDRHAP